MSKPGLLDRIELSQEQIARKWGLALDDDIVAWAAVEDVEPAAAEQHVVAGAAEQSVVAFAADQDVVAVAAIGGELDAARREPRRLDDVVAARAP